MKILLTTVVCGIMSTALFGFGYKAAESYWLAEPAE